MITLEQYRSGCTEWRVDHLNIPGSVKHWGTSDYSRYGVWNYYITLRKSFFQKPEDWERFRLQRQVKDLGGSKWETATYEDVPDLNWHGGITFGELSRGFDKSTGEEEEIVRLGCDYNHSWDQGIEYSLEEVTGDLKRSVEVLAKIAPLNARCAWSGRYDHPDKFYTSANGLVHLDFEGKIDYPLWQRA